MATIAKFYLHDAATLNTGTMPSGVFVDIGSGSGDATGDATGARTARAADDVIGVSQTSSSFTSNADTTTQSWGQRRFVSAPLAAHTFASADGNWTFSYARSESNLLHNQAIVGVAYCWRPSTGLAIGTFGTGSDSKVSFSGTEPTVAATQQAESLTAAWNATHSVTIIDGDILVFDIYSRFTQSMGAAYTDSFFYDGTTEASATSCASFITPPAALTLFTPTTVIPGPTQALTVT